MSDIGGVSSSSNMLRMTGLATGLDTDSMVKKMMAAETVKLDKLKQNKQYTQWQQDAYRDIIKDFRDLRDNYLLIDSPQDTNLIKSQAYSGATITSSDDSLVAASALPGAANGVTKVTVTQMARSARMEGSNLGVNTTISTKLSDLDASFVSQDFYIKQAGKVSDKITITKDDTIQSAIDKINNAQAKNGQQTNTLYSDLQVKYSELTKGLIIETRNTGSAQSIQITSDSGGTTPLNLNILGLADSGTQKVGQDAVVAITPPGASSATTVTKSSNSFTIDNVTYNILKDPNGISYDVNLTAKPDSQKSYDKIKAFIDKYNTLVKKISDKVQENKNYDYKPLTDAQRENMKDDQIKTWEDKAKQGILKNDSDLQNVLYQMRNAFTSTVNSAGLSLKDVGIDTYSGYEAISKPGQLTIDETKLKSALETRGDQVMKLFTASPDSSITDSKEKYNNTGIFERVEDIINTSSVKSDGTLLKKAGYAGSLTEFTNTLTGQLNEQQKAIDEMNKKFSEKEENYYQMFSKLETAMNQMNAQQSQLSQMLGGS